MGIGIDIVSVPRFSASLARTPSLRDRLFTAAEQTSDEGNPRTETSLAARFAAKEAVAKALGAPQGMAWHDCEVLTDRTGRPWIRTARSVTAQAQELGVHRWHVSLTHDGDVAVAYVIAEAG